MPDDRPVVTLLHAEPMPAQAGRERIVVQLASGDIAVATRKIGEEAASSEISFNLGEAMRLAQMALGGNALALTMPGLSRILCAAIIALSRAALLAGALEPVTGEPSEGDDETTDQSD